MSNAKLEIEIKGLNELQQRIINLSEVVTKYSSDKNMNTSDNNFRLQKDHVSNVHPAEYAAQTDIEKEIQKDLSSI